MKERHWNSLVTSLRHGQGVLVLGPELMVAPEGQATAPDATTFIDALVRELASELEDDNRRVTGTTLAAVAQQYEDANSFGPVALKASAEKFYKTRSYAATDVHRALAALPFSLILTTCHDALLTQALFDAGEKPVVQATICAATSGTIRSSCCRALLPRHLSTTCSATRRNPPPLFLARTTYWIPSSQSSRKGRPCPTVLCARSSASARAFSSSGSVSGAFLGAPALYLLPLLFPLLMTIGAALGFAGTPLPGVEVTIAASALVLGVMVAAGRRIPLWAAGATVALFAIFHGHAHGTEVPAAADAVTYALGFVIGTSLLHLVGILIGLAHAGRRAGSRSGPWAAQSPPLA